LTEKELRSVNGIGQALAEKIVEYRTRGKITFFEELKKTLPKGLPDLLEIP
jgi:DNA polymerase (family 10)